MNHTLILCLISSAALAGAPRYRTHTITIASAACPTGAPGVASDGVEWGMSLSGIRGWKVTVEPEAGETITGAGSLKTCVYLPAPWGPGEWVLAPEHTWSFTGKVSTLQHPAITLGDTETVVGLSDRVFVFPSTDFGVSGGTTVTIYLEGETR